MKTLKFMLAAATAIGFASAMQAAQNTQASTGFEKLSQGTSVVTGLSDNDGNSYFYYAGSTAEDNESQIVAAPTPLPADEDRPTGVSRFTGADLSSRANALKVSTGTDPLLRTFRSLASSAEGLAPQAAAVFTDDTYVDTLVQFTVTPYTDSVTPTASDKLMIYLKECTNDVGVISGTNLVVVGGYSADGFECEPHEYEVKNSNLTILPNEWHRLTVQCVANLGKMEADEFYYPAFRVYIDGEACEFSDFAIAEIDESVDVDETEWEDTGFVAPFDGQFTLNTDDLDLLYNKQVVFSLLCNGATPATLQAVGFAGEGVVDDLVVTTTDPFNVNIVDFTFDRSGEGVGAVSFTVNGGDAQSFGGKYEVTIGDTIVVTAAAQSGYELIAPTTSGLAYVSGDYASCTYTVTGTASLTINAQEQQNTPLEPGQQDSTTYNSQSAAETAAAKVVIGVPTAVATAFGDDAVKTAAYKALFAAKVVSDDAGGYKVEVGLTAAAEATLQDQVDDDAAEVIEDLSESTVTLTTTPGLYYSFEYGTSLENMTEGARTLATGATLTLDRPTTQNATAGFYKVLVNVTDKE